MRVIAFAAALMLASPVIAQEAAAVAPTSLTLAEASQVPTGRTIIDGANWRCEATGQCVASGGSAQPAQRACRRVVARLGPVSAFSWKGETLDESALATCNTAAR